MADTIVVPAAQEMAGPYATLAEACDRCRVLDRAGDAVALIADRDSYRDYRIATPHDGKWWISAPVSLDLSGNAWGAGNCCSGRGGTPRYELYEASGAIVLRTELHVWREFKPGWGGGTGDAGSHKLVGDVLICRGTSCTTFEAPHCAVGDTPTFKLAGDTVERACLAADGRKR